MSAPMYVAMGGTIWAREHQPMTLAKARMVEQIHRMNAAYQLSQNDERSLTARLALAKVETALAEEMAAAIAEITNPERKAAA
jgi:hypothetical protein